MPRAILRLSKPGWPIVQTAAGLCILILLASPGCSGDTPSAGSISIPAELAKKVEPPTVVKVAKKVNRTRNNRP